MTNTSTRKMHKGVLYQIAELIVCKLMFLNPHAWFRALAEQVGKKMNNKYPLNPTDAGIRLINYKRNAADLYIILKWLFILWITFENYHGILWLSIKWYFIITNLQSFFFHFIWKEQRSGESNADRLRRRMVHLFLAIFFSHLVFASIYRLEYLDNFDWKGGASFYKSCLFSISNSFAGNYTGVEVTKHEVDTTLIIQFLISFVFVSVIIGKAIPDYGQIQNSTSTGIPATGPSTPIV